MKKILKIILIVFLSAALIFAGVVYFSFSGNPVAKILANISAPKYIENNYPDMEISCDKCVYDFKWGDYLVNVFSKISTDTHFTLYLDNWGNVLEDTYESKVLSKRNTADRINNQYWDIVKNVFEKDTFPYASEIGYGELLFDSYPSQFEAAVINSKDLEIDKEYDIYELGKDYGYITLYIDHEDISINHGNEILLDIKNILDSNNVTFKTLFFCLEKPKTDTPRSDDDQISFLISYEDIYEEDLESRIINRIEELKAYYEEENNGK